MLRPYMTAIIILSLFAVVLMAQQKSPAHKTKSTGDLLPFQATEKTLPNGLKVIVVSTGFANIVSLQIPVQTGSRNEVEPGKSGFAHFFEHMMFRGTKAYPPDRYKEILTRAGARQNAYTSYDFTNYHTTFAKEDLETLLKVEADRFQNLSYSEAAFKTEARAVLGEYNKNSADPLAKLAEVQLDNAFTTHTYKHTVIGFLKDIEDMPNQFEYSKTFFDRWYRPEYTTILVVGDVTPGEVIPLVEKYWGQWKRGSFKASIPQEPPPKGPVYAHVPWTSPTLPWVTVAFHGPAFSETEKDFAAMDILADLYFGTTSDLYRRLVEQEQKVDQLFPFNPPTSDPSLVTIAARVKRLEDAVYVRNEVLKTVAQTIATPPSEQRLADAKSKARYDLLRSLDNTEAIAATLARHVRFYRSYDTLNKVHQVYAVLTPADLQAVAKKYFSDNRLVVTTLSKEPMSEEMSKAPSLSGLKAKPAGSVADLPMVLQKSSLPQLSMKLLFSVGSAQDPKGKEGLATLTAAMVASAGSKELRIDEIKKALFPIAGVFRAQVDKEMTTFTGSIHRDNWSRFADLVLPMLLEPGFREDDFKRLKENQLNALKQDLRSNNEEELGKERLQANIFANTAYGHPALGTVAGLESITLADIKDFWEKAYTRSSLMVGLAGDVPDEFLTRLKSDLARLDADATLSTTNNVTGRHPQGFEIEIIQKETRSTAISFGHPIEVARSHPDFAALSVARAWLGEHRSSISHLYQRIRELRGMNYGDYAYIEAFPRGMFRFFPDPNTTRHAQIFEVWIRPVIPENAHMAIRIAVHEVGKLIENGISQPDFEATRDYLTKNLYLMTATQDQQLGYALDSKWYGIGEFTSYMREQLKRLTLEDVNRAIKKHLSAKDLSFVIITKDAQALRELLVSDAFSPIKYDAEKPEEVLKEDEVIGAKKLNIKSDRVKITPVEEVFAK